MTHKTIQVNNTLPFNFLIRFTAGEQKDTALSLLRNGKVNIPVYEDDVFSISLSNDSGITFFEGLTLNSDQLKGDRPTLVIDSDSIKSVPTKVGSPMDLSLEFSDFNYRVFDQDGNLSSPQSADDVTILPGQVIQLETQDGGQKMGYLFTKTQAYQLGDETYYKSQLVLLNSAWGNIKGNEYNLIANDTTQLDNKHLSMSNYVPGCIDPQSKKLNLYQGQIVFYDQLPGSANADGTPQFPDGTNFIIFDTDSGKVDGAFNLIKDYMGTSSTFSPVYAQLGNMTSVDMFDKSGFQGSKTTKSDPGFQVNSSDLASFQLQHLETEAQAHMHVLCSLASGLYVDSDKEKESDKKVQKEPEYRTTITLNQIKVKDKKAQYPSVQFEIASQSDDNEDFSFIRVNGKKYPFDKDTNQTDYIPTGSTGKIVASLPLSKKRIGAPMLYVRTELMPPHTTIATQPDLEMRERMAQMVDSQNKPYNNFKDHIIDKAKKGGITLKSEDAEKVKTATQQLYKTVVHGFKHTHTGNDTHHQIEGKRMYDSYAGIEFKGGGSGDDMLTLHDHDGKTLQPSLKKLFGSSSSEMSLLTGSNNLGVFGDITHFIVTTADEVKNHISKLSADALKELKKIEQVVEHALVAAVQYETGEVGIILLDTADAIAKVAGKIYHAIKVAVDDLVDFFKFLLNAFKDISEVYDFINKNIEDTYQKFLKVDIAKTIENGIDDLLDDISKYLKLPEDSKGLPSKEHKKSSPTKNKGKEKLEWLLGLLFHEVMGESSGKCSNPVCKFIQDWEKNVASDALNDVKDAIQKAIKDNPDSANKRLSAILENLKDSLEKFPGQVINAGKKAITDEFEPYVTKIQKGLSTNPFDQPISAKDNLPDFLHSDTFKALIELTGLSKKIPDFTPANLLSLLYAIPGGIMLALDESGIGNTTADNADDKQEDILKISQIVGEFISLATTSIEMVSSEEEDDSKGLLPIIKSLLLGVETINGGISLALNAVDPDSDALNKIVQIILSAKSMSGILLEAVNEPKSPIPIDQIIGIINGILGAVTIVNSLVELGKGKGAFENSAGIFDGLSDICEFVAILDEEPDSKAIVGVASLAFRAFGAVFLIIDFAQS